ncbi:glycosyltransferase family 2 protein [Chloroflexota bacterium]|nr:glycosyltransferase family 2 protein [Chloroflexota bacterium]
MKNNLLSVVVPIYNEEEALRQFLPPLIAYCRDMKWTLVLINDGSTDGTKSILEEYEPNPDVVIFHHGINHGYGGALKTGISKATTEYIVTMDADGQHNPEDVVPLLQLAINKQADLVVGSRPPEFLSSSFRSIGKWLIHCFARFLMPLPIKDLNSGFKLYRTDLVQKYIELCPDSMAFSDIITLIFINQRHLVLEHPISINKRIAGKSTISVHTAFDTVVNILNIAMMFKPLRFFLPLSFIFILLGISWGLPIIIMGRGLSVGSTLAIFTGLLFFVIGLIANQLSAMRLQLINSKS